MRVLVCDGRADIAQFRLGLWSKGPERGVQEGPREWTYSESRRSKVNAGVKPFTSTQKESHSGQQSLK